MGFTEEYMLKLNGCNHITVLEGEGEFLEYDTNEVYRIHSIKLPLSSNGKHVALFSKEEGYEDTVEDREYFDGKILSFICKKVDHWYI